MDSPYFTAEDSQIIIASLDDFTEDLRKNCLRPHSVHLF